MVQVTPLIMGGLGNQLFMIANTYAYSLKYNFNFCLENKKDCDNRPVYYHNLLINLQKYITEILPNYVYREPYFHYLEIPKIDSNLGLFGYYQSEKYFREYKNEIKTLFQIPQHLNNFIFEKDGVNVAIHIRRTDYLKNLDYHPVQTKEYYEDAKQIIQDKLGFRPTYLYFSDDKQWVKDNFIFENKDRIIELEHDYEEFIAMQSCDHFIIANSSFSWWASWLSNYENKIVIAPKIWFGPRANSDWKDIYCEDWIVI